MPDYLLDSNVLIRHLRRHQPTTDLLAALTLDGQLGIATISRTEIIEGMRDHERDKTRLLLDALMAYPLTIPIADLTGDYLRHYRAQGVILDKPDVIIAATAAYHGLTVVTYNVKDFPMAELRLYAPMPE
jgi:hypothetical protein